MNFKYAWLVDTAVPVPVLYWASHGPLTRIITGVSRPPKADISANHTGLNRFIGHEPPQSIGVFARPAPAPSHDRRLVTIVALLLAQPECRPSQRGLSNRTVAFSVYSQLQRHRRLVTLTDNDPSAGSPTETLLRLLLPLNDQV